MGFIPVQLSLADLAALEPYHGKALEFTPSARSELLLDPHDIANSPTHGNLFDLFDLSNYLKIHVGFHLLISDHDNSPNVDKLTGAALLGAFG